ncbi:MAG: undecaprenyl-diphosphate phosphatase [Phycisphaeraceae bacterium]|nr:undecaprenyl-diphosphate phosphatase [Phycisphaeraceae bacterium]
MTWWQALILGLVEGLTEYLPVSSTGHLILAQRAMGLEGGAADAYAICIQSGAIIAVLGLYYRRVRRCCVGWLHKAKLIKQPDQQGFQLGLNILVAFMPAAVVGVLFDEKIEQYLFGLWPIVAAWFFGGVVILAVAWRRKGNAGSNSGTNLESITWRMALAIGMIQCIAMWPGVSRSLVTIVGGVLAGLSLSAAVEFSFLLGVVTLLAATVFKIHDAGPAMLEAYGWQPMILGTVAAWLSAVIAIKWMVAYLKKHGLAIFGYYRVAIAIVVAVLILSGVIVQMS